MPSKNEKAVINNSIALKEDSFENFDLDELESKLQEQLDEELADLKILQEEKDKINSPDALGETIKNVIWEQFINQIATTAGEDFIKENNGLTLDLRNEAHIQTAENFAEGKIATHNHISKEQLGKNYDRYKNTPHKEFRDKYVDPGMDATLKRAGELKKKGIDYVDDIYTGKKIPTDTKLPNGKNNPKAAQREHVKSSSEIYNNPSLQMSNDNESLAGVINNPEILQGYTTAERNNRKSDKTSGEMEKRDKTKHWKKANEKAEEYIKEQEKAGEERLKQEGRKTQKEEAFRIGGKALRAVIMQFLAELVKEIGAKLVKWFKSAEKKLQTLITVLKEAITSFISKIKTHLINAGNTAVTTIATAIFGPIVSTIKKVWTLLKQGWKSLREAIAYIRNPENKGKSVGVLLLEVGKILIAGLSAVGAIVLSEVIEKALIAIPGVGAVFAFEIPLLGSLGNILGIFLGAVVSGIVGAIAINLIQKRIEKIRQSTIVKDKIDKGNSVLQLQHEVKVVSDIKTDYIKEKAASAAKERHGKAANIMSDSLENIAENFIEFESVEETQNEIDKLFAELESE